MKQIILHGLLKKVVCPSFKVRVNSFEELIYCMSANFANFNKKRDLIHKELEGLAVVVDGVLVENLVFLDERIKNGQKIELIPVAKFSLFILAGTTLAATIGVTGATAAFVVNTLFVVAVSIGISMLVSKIMTPKDPKQVKTSSYIFSSKDNIAARNTPIPINYGRLRIGSSVISSLVYNFDKTNELTRGQAVKTNSSQVEVKARIEP